MFNVEDKCKPNKLKTHEYQTIVFPINDRN